MCHLGIILLVQRKGEEVGGVSETPSPENVSLRSVFSSTSREDYKTFVLQKPARSKISVLQEGHHKSRH